MLNTLSALALLAQVQASPLPEAFMSWPDVFQNQVVFTAEGDLWLGDLTTLEAKRITSDIGLERQAHFSPDGSEIAFLANYDGANAVYRMKLKGGSPEQLTFDQRVTRNLNGYSLDGKKLLIDFPSKAPIGETLGWLDIQSKQVQDLPMEFASFSSVGPSPDQIALTRVSQTWQNWFGYQGGQVNPIWFGDTKSMKFKKVYASKGSNEYPCVAGGRIYFCQDDDGRFSIKSVKTDGSDLKSHAGPYDVPLQQLRGDGTRLVYMKGPGLETIDLATGAVKPLNFRLASDAPKARPFLVNADAWIQNANLTPDAKRVLVDSRGQIVSVPVKDGAAKVLLSKPGARLRWPAYSPDKAQIAYTSDETGEDQIYVANADGTNPVAWTKGIGRSIMQMRWSPDGKWIAYTDSFYKFHILTATEDTVVEFDRFAFTITPLFDISPDGKWIVAQEDNPLTGFASIALYDIANKKKTALNLGLIDCRAPAFSSDGKWLGFLSNSQLAPEWDPILNQMNSMSKTAPMLIPLRSDEKSPLLPKSDEEPKKEEKTEKAEAFRIDLEGLEKRVIRLPAEPEIYSEIQIAGDRVLLPSKTALAYYDLGAKKSGVITSLEPFAVVPDWHYRSIQVSKDASKVLILGPKPRVVSIDADDQKETAGAINFGAIKIEVDPKAEWNQIYNEGWRVIRDHFYAENLHGIDWTAVRKKYQALIPLVRDRSDLNYVMKWLESEINTGHMYTGGGDTRTAYRPQPGAFLGAELVPDGGFLKIQKILRGNGIVTPSPLAAPGLAVKDGDYLISVAGQPATGTAALSKALRGRAGKSIEVKVNSTPSADGARSILIEPIGSETDLRYYDWVEGRRAYVAAKSGGKFGYIHLRSMGAGDFGDFIRQYFAQQDKDGLVVDIRFNGGGNLAGPITTILSRTVKMWGNMRNAGNYKGRDTDAFLGHLVCLVNEHSYSEGEGFPFYFRAAKLGPIIGKRTWGGYVGSWPDWPMVDGSFVAVSHYGGWTEKENWVIEATGVVPDKELDNDPEAFAKGVDMQLDEAIAYLTKQSKERPVVWPKTPPFPNRAIRTGKGGK